MNLKRLTPADSDLLREAWEWDKDRPSWYAQMDHVFSQGSVDNLITQLKDWRKLFIGIFDPDLTAIVIIKWKGEGRFGGDLMAKSSANPDSIVEAIIYLEYETLKFGMKEINVWVAERNRGVRRICERANLKPDGVVMFRGAYRGRVIRWLRHSLTREDLDAQADIEHQTAVFQSGHVLADSARV